MNNEGIKNVYENYVKPRLKEIEANGKDEAYCKVMKIAAQALLNDMITHSGIKGYKGLTDDEIREYLYATL